MKQQRILLIIGGGIAAYKCLDLVRRLRDEGASVRAVMTRAAAEFVTPLSVAALTNERVFTELFDLNNEHEIGHIRLSREADLIVVAPATADLLARMAGGHATDLATTVLLATDKPVLAAPAMNPRMWLNPATQRNVALLKADGIRFVGPNTGEMAERDEAGPGRLADVPEIIAAARAILAEGGARSVTRLRAKAPLAGRHVLVTSGPTHEPIDPVRYIANRSSGKQGHAVAAAAAYMGARVTLISGPVALPDPAGVETVRVETAEEMLAAVERSLPADVAVFAAAVADWRTAVSPRDKIKKTGEKRALDLVENPDILATIGKSRDRRPALVSAGDHWAPPTIPASTLSRIQSTDRTTEARAGAVKAAAGPFLSWARFMPTAPPERTIPAAANDCTALQWNTRSASRARTVKGSI